MEQRGLQGSCDPTDADCRGFADQSLCKALSKLEPMGLRAIQSSTGTAKTHQVALAEEKEALIYCCYDAKHDLSTPGGSPGCQILKDLKHLMTPGIITDMGFPAGSYSGDSIRPVV